MSSRLCQGLSLCLLWLCLHAQAGQDAELTLISLNLAHGRGTAFSQLFVGRDNFARNLKRIGASLAPFEPDLVALQEADAPSRWSGNFNHVEFLAQQLGLAHIAHSRHIDNWAVSYGTALLSRLPIDETQHHGFAGSFPTPNKGFTLIRTHWQPDPAKPPLVLDVVSLHLDFSRQSVRLEQIDELLSVLAERHNPVIIMGDFNDHRLASELLPTAAAERGLTLHTHPQAGAHPTYDDAVLDWILLSPELEFVSYQVLDAQLSDHRAVIARVRAIDRAPAPQPPH